MIKDFQILKIKKRQNTHQQNVLTTATEDENEDIIKKY
jgi:hypothetical protein